MDDALQTQLHGLGGDSANPENSNMILKEHSTDNKRSMLTKGLQI
jgi:hypothetical protein